MEFIYFNSLNTELENTWKELESNNDIITPFQTLEWIKNFIIYNKVNKKKNYEYYFIIVKKNKKAIVIFPLAIHFGFFKTLEYIGKPFNDINIPLIAKNYTFKPDEIKKIQNEIKIFFNKKVDCIYFKNQPFYLANDQKNFFIFEKILSKSINYKININENYLTNIKKMKFYKDLNRRNKKYIIPNLIHYKSLETKQEKEMAFNFYLKFKYDQLERTYRKNYLKSDSNTKFLKSIFLENKVFILSNQRNEIIACASCILKNKILYYLFPTYNYLYQNFALGQQLLKYIIFDSARDFDIFDFTIGEENYKKYWANYNSIYYETLTINNLKGFFFKLILKIKKIIIKNSFIYSNILKIIRR